MQVLPFLVVGLVAAAVSAIPVPQKTREAEPSGPPNIPRLVYPVAGFLGLTGLYYAAHLGLNAAENIINNARGPIQSAPNSNEDPAAGPEDVSRVETRPESDGGQPMDPHGIQNFLWYMEWCQYLKYDMMDDKGKRRIESDFWAQRELAKSCFDLEEAKAFVDEHLPQYLARQEAAKPQASEENAEDSSNSFAKVAPQAGGSVLGGLGAASAVGIGVYKGANGETGLVPGGA